MIFQVSFKDIEISQKLLLDYLKLSQLLLALRWVNGLEFCTMYPEYVNKLISISSGYKLSTFQLFTILNKHIF